MSEKEPKAPPSQQPKKETGIVKKLRESQDPGSDYSGPRKGPKK